MGPLCHGAWVTAPPGDGQVQPPGACSSADVACASWSSISPTVFVALASGRRRLRRSAATRRRRKTIVWPATSSNPIVRNSSNALSQSGQPHAALSGVKTMRTTRTTSWKRKQPRPGPRSAARSSPLYWIGPVERGGRGGVGSTFGSGCVTSRNDTGGGVSLRSAVADPWRDPRRPRRSAARAGSPATLRPSRTAIRPRGRYGRAASPVHRSRSAARRADRTR